MPTAIQLIGLRQFTVNIPALQERELFRIPFAELTFINLSLSLENTTEPAYAAFNAALVKKISVVDKTVYTKFNDGMDFALKFEIVGADAIASLVNQKNFDIIARFTRSST